MNAFIIKKAAPIAAWFLGFVLLEYLIYQFADRMLDSYVRGLSQTDLALIGFFQSITDLGKAQWYLWPCGLAALFTFFLSRGKDVPRRYRLLFTYIGTRALFLFCTIAVSGIVADIIKPVLGRARPLLLLKHNEYGFFPFSTEAIVNSMPSGHTTTAFALACSLSILYPRLRILWLAGALTMAASRIMVEAHYLSDVLAGAALGWVTVAALTKHGIIHKIKVIFPIDASRDQV